MKNGYVKSRVEENIGIIEFFHPKGNSLPGNLLSELTTQIKAFCTDNEVKVIILKSAGEKAFCAGASFDELIKISNLEEGKKFFSGFGDVINAMKTCPKFVIASVQGKAVGGGVGIISAADYVIAVNSAMVRLSELTIGIAPFVIASSVEEKIGKAAFMEMTIDTEWKDSNWAYQKGLFTKLTNDYASLQEETLKLANKLSNYSSLAVKEIKNIFWSNNIHREQEITLRAELSGKLVLGKEAREFLDNFKKGNK